MTDKILKKVVLPDPLGPINPMILLFENSLEISEKMGRPGLYCFVRFLSSSIRYILRSCFNLTVPMMDINSALRMKIKRMTDCSEYPGTPNRKY